MCKNQKTVREIAAAARTHLTKLLEDHAACPAPASSAMLKLIDSTMIASTIHAYTEAGIIGEKEANAWALEWNLTTARGSIETVVCDDCGARITRAVATILGDNDLCLCESCKDRTCGPQMTHEQADAISDGRGDFGDMHDIPEFQRDAPVELD